MLVALYTSWNYYNEVTINYYGNSRRRLLGHVLIIISPSGKEICTKQECALIK